MFINTQKWRASASGVGLDELYKSIDPFDVSMYTFKQLKRLFIRVNSTQNASSYLKLGRCGSIR